MQWCSQLFWWCWACSTVSPPGTSLFKAPGHKYLSARLPALSACPLVGACQMMCIALLYAETSHMLCSLFQPMHLLRALFMYVNILLPCVE